MSINFPTATKMKSIGFLVRADLEQKVKIIAKQKEVTASDVYRAFLEAGYLQYQNDLQRNSRVSQQT